MTQTSALSGQKICFIGAGNMASAIIGGLVAQGVNPKSIIAAEPSQERLDALHAEYGIEVSTNNDASVAQADVVVLCVKPQILQVVSEALATSLKPNALVISIAAGIELGSLETWLGQEVAIVRCMPNTPAQVLRGASGLYANAKVSTAQKQLTSELFSAIGLAEWVDSEGLLHGVTALSGSGPAYIFLVIDSMAKAAQDLGIEADTAKRLAAQTVLGAAEMVLQSELAPEQLKRNVMSPGGTTERAIQSFEEQGLPEMFAKAMRAANDRSVELADLLKGN